jgi:hypothetical protein
MSKNVLLLLCFGLVALFLKVELHKHVSNAIGLERQTIAKRLSATPAGPIVGVGEVVPATTRSNCCRIALQSPVTFSSRQAVTNTAITTESAELEKYAALRAFREFAAKDPESALAAAIKLPEANERNQALAAVCFGLAQSDPADAVKMAKSLHLDEHPGAIMENLVQQWAGTDLPSALDWANSQPAGEQRDGLTTRIAYVMSQNDPSDAAQLVINQIPSGPIQDDAVISVLNQWGNQDMIAAAVWVKSFPEGQLQQRAISELEGIENHQGPPAGQ